ncbi:type II CAAX endopeptidase family protein [Zemynaea arenosa]|nr:type II CAAX endopeptidase family protein [Massilia arenosa]
MTPASTLRAVWLLSALRLRRIGNMFGNVTWRKAPPSKPRTATPARRRFGIVLSVVMAAIMVFAYSNMEHEALLNILCYLDPSHDLARPEDDAIVRGLAFTTPTLLGATLQMALLLFVSLLLPLGSRELAQPDWDLEWLATLPLRRGPLLCARVLERTVANPTGVLALGIPCIALAWFDGYRWLAPLLGSAAALCLLAIAAQLRTLADTGLRIALAPSQLRNVQAICAMGSIPAMYMGMAFGMAHPNSFVFSAARAVPEWALWTPPGLAVRALAPASGASGTGVYWVLLLAQTLLILLAGMALLRWQLRNGVVATSSRESSRHRTSATVEQDAPLAKLMPRSPLIRRELRLLSRDRNFMLQSLFMPVLIIGTQMFFNGSLSGIGKLGADPGLLAVTAFGLGTYMLMLSAFQTLNNEGHALWMLYTFPVALERVLKQKAMLWAGFAALYPLAVFGFGLATSAHWDAALVSRIVLVLAAIPVFAAIAVALGVFACDPLAQDIRTRVRPSYVYLYMMLSAMYGYAIYGEAWHARLALIVLVAGLAQALWQKARDELPYLLDPAAAPPARVSTADGLMAAMAFFVGQAFLAWLAVTDWKLALGQALLIAFAGAGIVVYALVRFIYWRSKTADVPRLVQANLGACLGWGTGLGVVATAFGLAYLWALNHSPLAAELQDAAASGLRVGVLWMVPLAVVAAPLCEEFIFRGLIFGGLRRSLRPAAAMALSAALFAVVHPPLSMLPVFVLGLGTALAYARTGALLAPMLVHAIYNAALVAVQSH